MKRGFLAVVLGAMVVFAIACKSKTDQKEAIRAGVIKHLTALNMLNLNNMDISVTQATVNGNQAQAQVEVRAKGGDSAGKRDADWLRTGKARRRVGGIEEHRHGRGHAASWPRRSATGRDSAGRDAPGASQCDGRERPNSGDASGFQRNSEQRAEPAAESAGSSTNAPGL